MSSYYLGICVGLFIGAIFSFILRALMVTAKRADEQATTIDPFAQYLAEMRAQYPVKKPKDE